MPEGTSVPIEAKNRPRIFLGWYIVAASVTINILTSAAYFQGFQAFFLPITHTFGWSRTATSGAFSLRQVESGLLSPVLGPLADRWPRLLIILGSLIAGAGIIGLSQTRNLPMFYLFFVLASAGTAGTSHGLTWAVILLRWFVKRRGAAMGIATLGPLFGGPFVVLNTLLVTQLGWRPVLFGYGVLVAVVGAGLGFWIRERPEPHGYLPDGALVGGKSLSGAEGDQWTNGTSPNEARSLPVRQMVRTKDFWVLTLFLGSAFMGTSAMQVHQLPYFESIGFSDSKAALTVVLASVASGIGRLGAGGIMDIVDYRLVLAGAAALMCGAFVYLAVVPVSTFVMAVPFGVVFGLAWGSSVPIRPLVGGMVFGTRSLGTVVGLMGVSSLIGGIIGPLLMGVSFDATGSYGVSLWVMAAVSISTLPLLLLLKPSTQLPLVAP